MVGCIFCNPKIFWSKDEEQVFLRIPLVPQQTPISDDPRIAVQ